MSYPKDLDEYSERTLIDEIARRETCRRRGRCDYCGRAHGVAPACKFPVRHAGKDTK
jgi:hypothetical protein